ncbi:MAG: COR domain-containing protein [Nostocaceae cyanobacterium]|nr:COR domain-containing protein [Nostocaceae cyanobacterium]
MLNLDSNQLKKLPESITQLSNLTMLSLAFNQLITIPESLTKLSNLTILDLSSNKFKTLPEFITKLSNLTVLHLSNNPLETPPIEIAEEGIEAIREYFRQIQQEGEDYIYEAKLLIVGESGSGKTTLAKTIENPNYQLQENEASTEGIDVSQWHFTMTNGQDFRVNIWDFGGQEIYHGTHQFFLTKRSLYILVADTRKEDTDFYYWLNIVELQSDNSPLLILKNEKQDRKREINERALRGRFINLKETLATNLATKRGFTEILEKLKYHIITLPIVGSTLPRTWKNVREALEKDPRNYISLEEYFRICQENGFTQNQDKLQLSGYLHDLGVCLHFQDDPILKHTVILKPEWGTDAVYKVLDNDTVKNNFGEFNRNNLADIWHEEKYAMMQDQLLQLMMKFKLCYQIPGRNDTYIAPQLLSENQPEYHWDETNNLILRYTYYKFMPKGIITQFIVVMHEDIDEQRYVWKSGVILHKDKTKAEVIEDYGKREITIRVAGRYKRDILTEVTRELDKIHKSYKGLDYSKLIPCNCHNCKPSQDPYFYDFEDLRSFAADGDKIQCLKSRKMIDARSLITDVIGKPQLSENYLINPFFTPSETRYMKESPKPPEKPNPPPRISTVERGIALTMALAVLVTFIVLVLYPRSMNSGTLAIVRFLAATFAGIAGYLFSGNIGLEAKIPLNKTQLRATGAFAAFVLVLFIFFVGVPPSN